MTTSFSARENASGAPIADGFAMACNRLTREGNPGMIGSSVAGGAAEGVTRVRLATEISAFDLCAGTRNANAELLHSRLQSRALHPQLGRGAVGSGNGPVGLFEGRHNLLALRVVQHAAHIVGASGGSRGLARGRGDCRDRVPVRHPQTVAWDI